MGHGNEFLFGVNGSHDQDVCHIRIMSRVMRKTDFCICKNKDADQLRSNCAANQRLCFRYMDCATPLLS